MYRQMTRQSQMPQIYCFREDCHDFACGKFHAHRLLGRNGKANNVRHIVGALEANSAVVNENPLGRMKAARPQLTVQTHSDPNSPKSPAIDAHPQQQSLSPQSTNSLPTNGAPPLSLALPPLSPNPSSPGSQASGLSGASVTLEDIIASARRKISEEYKEIRLPSPEFEEEDSTLWDKRAARKKLLFHESSLDIPAVDHAGEPILRGSQLFLHQYEDQESEAELVIQEEPPSFIGEDEEGEDFEEMIKASKPPLDAFSNPILLRDSDPLTTHKKRRHKMAPLPRQQSLSRLQQLGGGGGTNRGQSMQAPFSQSSTPSGHTDLGEDYGDTSSIDLSMTELSAAVGQGKSPVGSNGPSPSNILKFIEEQKQKGVGAGEKGEETVEN